MKAIKFNNRIFKNVSELITILGANKAAECLNNGTAKYITL